MARRKRERKGQQEGFEPDATAARPRLTPVEIQQKVFRLAFRGYNERDVDEFLDHVTEDLAALHEENKRLREQVHEGGGASTEGAKRQAETIVREAREHAARLVEEAERRGAAGGAAAVAAAAVPASFLVREREFLQRMASLVQSHARALKEDARRGRAAKPAEPPVAVPAPEAEAEAEPSSPPGPAAAEAVAVSSTAEIEEPEATPVEAPSEDQAVPTQEPGPQSPRDASAAWGSVGEAPEEPGSTPTASPWTQDRAPTDEPSKDDPLLAAWESAFLGPEGQAPEGAPRRKGDQKEGEPSLRELFWGEE